MAAPTPESLPELFGLLQTIGSDILRLRLEALPQPKFMMLLERAEELHQALAQCVKKIYRRKRRAGSEDAAVVAQVARTLAALRPLFKLLHSLRQGAAADLLAAEKCIRYNAISYELRQLKQRMRGLAARIEDDLTAMTVDAVIAKNLAEATTIASYLSQVDSAFSQLIKRSEPRFSIYYKNFGRFFFILENSDALSEVKNNVVFFLRSVSYQHVQRSDLFDQEFYLGQLEDKGRDVRDSFKHYLTNAGNHAAGRYFNDRYYLTTHPEVEQLRYNALEHFVRYGEVMRYDPCPEFDTIYYLRSNDDILDAGVSPISHFIRHGLPEGRPPSARAGHFFTGRYLDAPVVAIAFIGEPDATERLAWDAVRRCCAAQEGRQAVDIPAELWTGNEPGFAAFLIGSAAATRLSGEVLRAVTLGSSFVVYLGSDPQRDIGPLLEQDDWLLSRICAITPQYERFLRWQESEAPLRLHYYPFTDSENALDVVEALLNRLTNPENFAPRRFVSVQEGALSRPLISVVSIIYKKVKEMLAFLESLNRQDLARPYEVVLVDDASPDDAVAQVNRWLEERQAAGLLNKFMRVRVLRNEVNSGNCVSRNRGVEAAAADVVLVVDGDVVLSASSLTEHLWAYRFGDCDAVIGFFGFNMDFSFVFDWLSVCEINDNVVRSSISRPKDVISENVHMRLPLNNIYNFVTRNVSFKKESLNGQFFDTIFNYSKAKDSGYGEEDHEIGARLYFTQKKVRFVGTSVSVHSRHADNSYNANKAVANLRCWNRLIAKYPELPLVDRQYYQWRTRNLLQQTSSCKDSPEFKEAYTIYTSKRRANVAIRANKPLRILTYKWHVPHLYELSKLNHHQFTLVADIGTLYCNQWDYKQRPLPGNVKFMPLEQIDPRQYDFAILPFDEHVLHPKYCPSLSADWGQAFLTMLELTKDMRRAAICHGTPQIYERDDTASGQAGGTRIPGCRQVLRELLRDVHVVCNSHQAQREWEFARSSVIWQGFSPVEFPPGRHHKDCLTLSRKAYEIRPYYRGDAVRRRVEELLGEACVLEYTASPEPHPGYTVGSQEWSIAKFQNYTAYIGDFAVYFNPTKHSPMPRSRGEAMLTGTIPVSLRNHDVDLFINNGVNGFYGDSAEELAEQIRWLMVHEKERREISRQARLTAMDIFNIDRYLSAWSELIAEMV